MKKRLLALVLLSVATLAFSAGTEAAEKYACVNVLTTPPTIDGNLGTDEWANTGTSGPFLDITSESAPQAKTEAFFAHDDKFFYLAFHCEEPQTNKIVSKTSERDGGLWNDDCVEIFLDVDADRTTFVHLIVSASGTQYDALGEDATWNAKWTAAAGRGKVEWCAEIAIPFAELGVKEIKPGDIWLGSFCRERKPVAELSSWSPSGPTFSAPGSFGTLIFDSPAAAAKKQVEDQLAAFKKVYEALKTKPAVTVDALAEAANVVLKLETFMPALEQGLSLDDFIKIQSRKKELEQTLGRLNFALLRAELAGQPYLVWQANPWKTFAPRVPLSEIGGQVSSATATILGNDATDLAFMISNLSDETFSARVLFDCAVQSATTDFARVYFPQFVSAPDGRVVADAMVPPDEACALTVPAGETRQVWLRLRSKNVAPGAYQGVLRVQPLMLSKIVKEVTVNVDVSPVALPEHQIEQVLTWDYLGDAQTLGLEKEYYDLLCDHGVNVFLVSGLRKVPRVDTDGEGKFVKPLDFTDFRKEVQLKRSRGGTLYITMDIWEKDSVREAFAQTYNTPLWQKAFKATVSAMLKELTDLGLTNQDFLINPVDESCDQRYIDIAKLLREIDPNVRLIADSYTQDASEFNKVAPYVDTWVPHFSTFQNPNFNSFFGWVRSGEKPLGAYYYSEGANEKARDPYEYRVKHWTAFDRGVSAVGYWTATQHYGDVWHRYLTKAVYDPSLMYPGKKSVLPSRRLLAFHRGILDYERLALLKSSLAQAKASPDLIGKGKALIDEAPKVVFDQKANSEIADVYARRINDMLAKLLPAKNMQ